MSNTRATLIWDDRQDLSPGVFVELKIWEVPRSVPGSKHSYKYRLVYVVDGECVLRYDNERGKGDHRHFADKETSYTFTSLNQLMADFWVDVKIWNRWRPR